MGKNHCAFAPLYKHRCWKDTFREGQHQEKISNSKAVLMMALIKNKTHILFCVALLLTCTTFLCGLAAAGRDVGNFQISFLDEFLDIKQTQMIMYHSFCTY